MTRPRSDHTNLSDRGNLGLVKALTFLMFMMFAMTTDSVGVIIPRVIVEFRLGMTAAGSFHYVTMTGIAVAGFLLGFLADKLGRKATIVLGLVVFSASSMLFEAGHNFGFFLVLLFLSGAAIAVFKTGALALIGDISTSTDAHTATMNVAEGFFAVGSIIGPAIVARLLVAGASWRWLYVIVGGLCAVLIVVVLIVRYPSERRAPGARIKLKQNIEIICDLPTLIFSLGAMVYGGVEAGIYVWMPTLLAGYGGSATISVTYALSIFFILRAFGRFLGAWMLSRLEWTAVLTLCSLASLGCFVGTVVGGRTAAVFLLPLSGLFMSVIYPTLNSKGISCFSKSQHGAVAGVILFFTCVGAVLTPLGMGALSDAFGDPRRGFILATSLSALLFIGLACNWVINPTRALLARLDSSEY